MRRVAFTLRYFLAAAALFASTVAYTATPSLAAVGQRLLDDLDPQSGGAGAPSPPAGFYGSLAFERSSVVSDQARDSFLQSFDGGLEGGAPSLQAALGAFDLRLNAMGYSGTQLIDVTALALLDFWEAINGVSASGDGSFLAPMRYQLIRAYAGVPEMTDLSDAQQQQLAERLVYSSSLARQLRRTLAAKGDPALLSAFSRATADGVLNETGLDLRLLQPTPAGLTRK